jgi:hypothetical protein
MISHLIITYLAFSAAAIFFSLGMLHVYWALGRSSPSAAVIPIHEGKPLFTPTPATTLLVALALLICALVALGTRGIWRLGLPGWLFKIGAWGVAAAFLLRAIGDFRYLGFFKKVRDTQFARNDSRIFSPLCLWLAFSCATLAVFV